VSRLDGSRIGSRFPRIICEFNDTAAGSLVSLSPEESHHLARVLRRGPGDEVTIINSASSRQYQAVITSSDNFVTLKIVKELDSRFAASWVSILLFSLCKGDKNDFVAEKACELGVEKIIFWKGDHGVVKVENREDILKKTERWNKICASAAKQCGNAKITKASFAENIETAAAMIENGTEKFFASLLIGSTEISKIQGSARKSALVIGPEGDFSKREEEFLLSQKFHAINLGPLVLRAETAAVAGISGFNAVWGFNQ